MSRRALSRPVLSRRKLAVVLAAVLCVPVIVLGPLPGLGPTPAASADPLPLGLGP